MDVRTATPDDALAVETVRIRGWQTAYDGIVPSSYLDRLVVDAPRRRDLIARGTGTTLVAVDEDDVVGMAVHGPARDADRAGLVELYALYVDPPRWRSGVGSLLLAACPDVTSVWVLEQNTRARAFYAQHGFVADGRRTLLPLDTDVPEIRMVLDRG